MRTIKTVLVTGAAGGVGRTLCAVLSEEGFIVRGLVRPEDDAAGLPIDPGNLTLGYLEDPAVLDRALAGSDAVVNCAALLPNALHLGREAFRRVNVEAPLALLRKAGAAGIPMALFFSTISVVDHVTRTITPASLQDYITGAQDAYLDSKIALEKGLRELGASYGGDLGVLRPAFVYGPGNLAVWRDALRLLSSGKMRLFDNGRAALPLIYAEDIGRFVAHLLRRPGSGPSFSIYVLSDPASPTMREVFDLIADHLGVERPSSVPSWMAEAAAAAVSLLPPRLRVGRLALLTRARVLQYSRGYDLSGVLANPPLGPVPVTDYRVGLRRMLDDYLRNRDRGEPA